MPGGVQGLDRYAYVNNNPVKYTDPSGHSVGCDTDYLGTCTQYARSLAYKSWRESPEGRLGLKFVNDWDPNDKQAFVTGAMRDARAEYNAFCKPGLLMPGECGYDSPDELYRATHGVTTLTMSSTSGNYCERNANVGQQGTICYAGMKGKIDPILAAHELAHVFNALIANNGQPKPYNDLATERATNSTFPGIGQDITAGYNKDNAPVDGEDFANMYSMYVFNAWPVDSAGITDGGIERMKFMTVNMSVWVGRMLLP